MVRIRMSRLGRKHRPFYRINAIEKRQPRDGAILENLGWYNPLEDDASKQVELKEDRIRHWLSVGAQPSDTCKSLFAKAGIIDEAIVKAEHQMRYGKRMEAMKTELEAKKAAEEAAAKAEAEAKAKEEAEAKAAAEAAAAEAPASEESSEDSEKSE